MEWSWWIVTCAAAVVAQVGGHQGAPVVTTAQGQLRGKVLHTYTGQRIFSFIGVRYAEPPTGQNRFKAPIPVKPWTDVRNATEDSPYCPQIIRKGVPTSEDCLFLNVHTKKLTRKQSVIVFFHPGSFAGGTGNSGTFAGPQYFLDQDIVFVSLNYRLGALGFLSTGDAVLQGNYGLKDQLAALRWVQQNIARFGGDPQSATLFGYSAGSCSVQLHMVSPLSKGLFHKAIASSCSALSPSARTVDPASVARRYARILNCSTESSQKIRDCLLQIPTADLLSAVSLIWDTLQPPFSIFNPVIEPAGEEERFLPEDPVEVLRSGRFHHVPLIAGITKDEFNWRAQFVLINDTYLSRINHEFNEIAPWEFRYPRKPQNLSLHMSAAFKRFYFNNQPVSNATEKGLGHLYSDSSIVFSTVQAAKLIAQKSTAPVYLYEFNYNGRFSFNNYLGTNISYGVVHHNDLIYTLYIRVRFPLFNETDPDATMVRTMTSLYAEFARTGTPFLPEGNTQWLPLTQRHPRYLEITECPTMRDGVPHSDRVALWESLLPVDGPHRQYLY